MSNRIKHRENSYPLFNKTYIQSLDNNECYLIPLTERQIGFIMGCIGREDTPFTSFSTRWYRSYNGEYYEVVENDFIEDFVSPLIEQTRGALSDNMCVNQQLGQIDATLQQIVAIMEANLQLQQNQTVSLSELSQELNEANAPSLGGALDTVLKIRELFDILPGFDIQLKPADLVNTIMSFRTAYMQRQALERHVKYMGIVAQSLGGSDLIAFAETIWEALPLTDYVDEFSELPENTIDIARLLSGLFEMTQTEAILSIKDVIKECCDNQKTSDSDIIGLNTYPTVNGKGHTEFCQQLSTVLGRGYAILSTIKANRDNNVPVGVSVSEMVLNVLREVYNYDYSVGGLGVDKLTDLANAPIPLANFTTSFLSSIQTVMQSVDCKGSPSDFISLFEESMGISHSAYFDALLALMPPSRVNDAFFGSGDVVLSYFYVYGGNCQCTPDTPTAYPIIQMFDDYGNGREVVRGYAFPYEAVDLDQDNGYLVNFLYTDSINFVGDRVVSQTEGLDLTIGINQFTGVSSPPVEYYVTLDVSGVGISLGTIIHDTPTVNTTFTGINLPISGVPTIRITCSSSFQSMYVGAITLTQVGG